MRSSGAVCAIFLSLAALLNVVPSLTASANAEAYVALQLGAALPNKLSNVEGTGGLSGVTVGDLDVKSSFMFGMKAGYFFQSPKWLGVEIEIFTSTPDTKQQVVQASTPGGPALIQFFENDERATVWAFNVLARYPGEKFHPYIGVGPGIFIFKNADTVLGLNALVGGRFFLTKNIALFGEYKYNRASTEEDGTIIGLGSGRLQFDYSANILAFGASYHF